MNNLNLTKEEIFKICEGIVIDANSKCEQVEKLAKDLDVYVHTDHFKKAQNDIYKRFPELQFSSGNIYLINELDSVVSTVYNAIQSIVSNSLDKIHLESINRKSKRIKLSSYDSYHIYWFCKYWGIDENRFNSNLHKEYKNGSRIYDFSIYNKDIFEKFIQIFESSNEDTDKIINAITANDKLDYLEKVKSSYANPYMVIHDIKNRLGIKTQNLNFHLIKEKLSM